MGIPRVFVNADAELAVSVDIGPTWGAADRTVHVLPKQIEDKTVFIVVNEWYEPLSYTVTGLGPLNGTVYTIQTDPREVTVENGALALSIGGHGLQILSPR